MRLGELLGAIAVALLLAASPARAQSDVMDRSYDANLIVTEGGLLDKALRLQVLDIKNLEESLSTAQRYFDVRRAKSRPGECGSLRETPTVPTHELWRHGTLYACLTLARQSGVDGNIDSLYFVGPLADRFGLRPGDQLTSSEQFKPMRDCQLPEGIVTCTPSYGHSVSYEIAPCHGSELESEEFKAKRGRFPICAIYVW